MLLTRVVLFVFVYNYNTKSAGSIRKTDCDEHLIKFNYINTDVEEK